VAPHGQTSSIQTIEAKESGMNFLEWFLWASLFSIYIVCLFTVCTLTFRKGYFVLGIIGILLPILWLIGAVLPDKRSPRYPGTQPEPTAQHY
jgi:hypothetical protein